VFCRDVSWIRDVLPAGEDNGSHQRTKIEEISPVARRTGFWLEANLAQRISPITDSMADGAVWSEPVSLEFF
jgi:hypothetical protein